MSHRTTPPRSRGATDHVIDVMRRVHGHDIYGYDPSFLARSIEARSRAAGEAGLAAYGERLQSDPAEASALVTSLGIHHSEFFRDPLAFALLEQRVLPDMLEAQRASGGRELRVWSAGCAAGQEAYSVTLLLMELSASREERPRFRVFATDSSEEHLARARQGRYSEADLRHVRLAQLRRWFSATGHEHQIARELRDRVDFSRYDLLDPDSCCPPASIFGEFDVILCCNLLFYYRHAVRLQILDKLQRCLVPGGVLVTSESEAQIVADMGDVGPYGLHTPLFRKAG
ncbi:MAG: CheR family methyltransferase [Myxococcota bacterium]